MLGVGEGKKVAKEYKLPIIRRINSEDAMHSMVTIVNNLKVAERVEFKSSHHTTKCKYMR